MCRGVPEGGRRCPCQRGDRRRAYQRLRYAHRKAEQALSSRIPENEDDHRTTHDPDPSGDFTDLQDRRAATLQAVDAALAAYRANPASPQAVDDYTTAVIDHGAAVRDIALRRAAEDLAQNSLDDASIAAEAEALHGQLSFLDTLLADHRRADVSRHPDEGPNPDLIQLGQAKAKLLRAAQQRSAELNARRTEITRAAYYRELATERTFGDAEFVPANLAKMTRADRAMFTEVAALYPDEMVTHSASLGDMLAKRSKARAHYSAASPQRARRTRTEVLDLSAAMRRGRLTTLDGYYVDSPEAMAAGEGSLADRTVSPYATLPRNPDNERRVAELLAEFNAGRPKPATMKIATRKGENGPEEVIYVCGSRTLTRVVTVDTAAEITYADSSSMTHELAHRMEDRNGEISSVTKNFLRRRTAGLAKERYARSEYVVPDGFVDRYMGKDYPGEHHTELLSCGMEAIAHGRFGGLRGQARIDLTEPDGTHCIDKLKPPRADTEHLALILGILASANKQSR